MKKKVIQIQRLAFLISLIVLISCDSNTKKENSSAKDVFTIKTFQPDATGWGYDILKDNKVIIHQPNIPAIEGNHLFRTDAEARKIAVLVVEKLKNNIFPPSLTKEEVEAVIK
ncbi:MAG: DUF4907 domain-containing protein [Bacteroidetes bacterium]|nr:DUF4907 domain-containing protein [Bacteroidota bacterium]